MRKYNVTLQIFAAAGDDIDVDAINPQVAEQRARLIAEQRFENGRYELDLQEVCINCVEELAPVEDAPAPDRIFVLYDSRSRKGGRDEPVTHKFAHTPAGLTAVWDIVLRDEVADEYADYIGFASVFSLDEGPGVFNDYWAMYGWYLTTGEHDA